MAEEEAYVDKREESGGAEGSSSRIREIVLPGELVGEGLRAGMGTYREGSKVYASQVGIKSVRAGYVNVIPINGRYMPKVGDQVIGIITDVGPTYWMVDINSPYPAPLHVNEVPWKVEFGDTAKYLNIGDTVLVTVSNVDEVKHVQVSMLTQGQRRLNTGFLVEVTPSKVPRMIGKGGSMISMLKNLTHCRMFVGQNGRIWIDGEPDAMVVAAEAVGLIEREAHAFGLTERVKEFLESRMAELSSSAKESDGGEDGGR
ncbi:MAG: S1 RNA-binding domain-containing protein [Thermoplasmata archaeon]|nr:S1 RNA-binding domain-containing protein [Thermoplasmata archaeon]